LYFFVFLAKGFRGVENYVGGLWYYFAKKKRKNSLFLFALISDFKTPGEGVGSVFFSSRQISTPQVTLVATHPSAK